MTKREFLKAGLLTGAGFLAAPAGALGLDRALLNLKLPTAGYERGLFPYFWADDLIRLLHLAELPAKIIQALNTNHEYFQLGRAWSPTVPEVTALLEESRELLAADERDLDRAKTQFALCAGWAAARILDAKLEGPSVGQPLVRATDVAILHHLQEREGRAITASEAEIADLFRLVRQRNLLRLHTFRPEWADADRWIGEFMELYHALGAEDAAYARIYLNPPADLQPAVGRLYRPEDTTIQTAERVRYGQLGTLRGQQAALLASQPASAYGVALRDGFAHVSELAAFVAGKSATLRLE